MGRRVGRPRWLPQACREGGRGQAEGGPGARGPVGVPPRWHTVPPPGGDSPGLCHPTGPQESSSGCKLPTLPCYVGESDESSVLITARPPRACRCWQESTLRARLLSVRGGPVRTARTCWGPSASCPKRTQGTLPVFPEAHGSYRLLPPATLASTSSLRPPGGSPGAEMLAKKRHFSLLHYFLFKKPVWQGRGQHLGEVG